MAPTNSPLQSYDKALKTVLILLLTQRGGRRSIERWQLKPTQTIQHKQVLFTVPTISRQLSAKHTQTHTRTQTNSNTPWSRYRRRASFHCIRKVSDFRAAMFYYPIRGAWTVDKGGVSSWQSSLLITNQQQIWSFRFIGHPKLASLYKFGIRVFKVDTCVQFETYLINDIFVKLSNLSFRYSVRTAYTSEPVLRCLPRTVFRLLV